MKTKKTPKALVISALFTPPLSPQEITLDLEEALGRWTAFYRQKNRDVSLPAGFDQAARRVWNKKAEEIEAAVRMMGYDAIALLPPVPVTELPAFHKKMTATLEKTWESNSFREGGSFTGIRSPGADKIRVMLYHSVLELISHSVTKMFRGLNLMQATGQTEEEVRRVINDGKPLRGRMKIGDRPLAFGGLSVDGYLAVFAERNQRIGGEFLDESGWSWLMGSYCGRCVPGLSWSPFEGRLRANAFGPGLRSGGLAVHPAAVFPFSVGG